jgi:hypothetical protein
MRPFIGLTVLFLRNERFCSNRAIGKCLAETVLVFMCLPQLCIIVDGMIRRGDGPSLAKPLGVLLRVIGSLRRRVPSGCGGFFVTGTVRDIHG